jgi:oxaloacetate decarboxylase alpha subunit
LIVVQATVNVITGERYKIITNQTKELLRGGYGETPGPVNRKVQEKALKGEAPITCRPGDLIPNEMEHLRKKLINVTDSEEDILTYALFPHTALDFLEKRTKGHSSKRWKTQNESE